MGAHIEGDPIHQFFDSDLAEQSLRYAHQSLGVAVPRISQRIVLPELLENFVLRRRLGEGSFGIAFTCGRKDADPEVTEWVVKLSTNFIRREKVRELDDENAGRPVPLDNIIQPPHRFCIPNFIYDASQYPEAYLHAREALMDEFRNAEYILEPPSMRALTDDEVGAPIKNLSLAQYTLVVRDRKRWQALPGYTHLHPLLHFEPSVPMILSAQADGTLKDLRREVHLDLRPDISKHSITPPLWNLIARQLGSAVAFIDTHTPLAHIDIKPANVLFKSRGTPLDIHCWLSDYGLCEPKNEGVPKSDRLPGTTMYCPDCEEWRDACDQRSVFYRDLSAYQYFATLMDMLRLPCLKLPSSAVVTIHDFLTNTKHIEWKYISEANNGLSLRDSLCSEERLIVSRYRFLHMLWSHLSPYVNTQRENLLGTSASPFMIVTQAIRADASDMFPMFFHLQDALKRVQ